ncbi:MAG: PadR family transcriptional regulator [Candidatus Aminicenantes bacterium]|nr:PadR family transcriptional regulator [Candidatus Aminicenantes bacterium]
MILLSRAEETVLLAILGLKENAYGVSILEYIQEKTGMEWSLAQTYDPLKKLVRKGYVVKTKGEPTPERGGRAKTLYKLTTQGREALIEIRRVQDSLWTAVPKGVLTR